MCLDRQTKEEVNEGRRMCVQRSANFCGGIQGRGGGKNRDDCAELNITTGERPSYKSCSLVWSRPLAACPRRA